MQLARTFQFQSPNRYTSPHRDDPDSQCRVKVSPYEYGGPEKPGPSHLVIVTEIKTNPGMSITNSWEFLGPQITEAFDLAPGSMRVVERYTQKSYESSPEEETRLSEVKYDINDRGLWDNIRWDHIDHLGEVQAEL